MLDLLKIRVVHRSTIMRKSTVFACFLGAVLFIALPGEALACPNCYGAISNTEIAQGLQYAMLALIGATAMIGTGVVLFFSNMKKRSDLHASGETE